MPNRPYRKLRVDCLVRRLQIPKALESSAFFLSQRELPTEFYGSPLTSVIVGWPYGVSYK